MPIVYRPSAQVRLQIRIDEGADTAALRGRLEPEGAGERLPGGIPSGGPGDVVGASSFGKESALGTNRAAFRAVAGARALLSPEQLGDMTSRLEEQRTTLQLSGPEQVKPQGVQPVDDLVLFGGIVPIDCKIERNGVHDPDTCELTLNFRDAPIDPRIVRAVFVEVVLGTVSADDFEAGVKGARRSDGTLLSVVQRSEGQDVRFVTTTRFLGFVDEWFVDTTEDGDVVKLKCRDLTAALITKRLPSGVTIDLTKPLADGVQELLSGFASTRGMRVVFGNPSRSPSMFGDRGPVPSDAIPRSLRARRGKRGARARQGAKQMSLWDHVSDTVVATGFVPVLRGYTLFLAEPRTLYSDEGDGVRQLVYGRNLSSLKFARKLAADIPVPTVEVRCADPSIGKTRWARAPQLADQSGPWSGVFGDTNPPLTPQRANRVSSGGSAEEEIRVFVVSGFTDLALLERVAQSIYEQWGRQEIEGSFSTNNITSFDGDDGDLLDLQPADAVDVLVAPLNAESNQDGTNNAPGGAVTSLQELAYLSVFQRYGFLLSLGWSEATAMRLAEAQDLTRLVSRFRASTVYLNWSGESGLEISGDFINFFVVREEGGAAKAEPSAAASAASLGRTSDAAAALRDRSAASGTIGNQAESGELSPSEYAEQGSAANASQGRAAALNREVG